MKKIFLILWCSFPFLNSFLYAPRTKEQIRDDEAFFANHMNELIKLVTSKKISHRYSDRDMNTFLTVAIALKNGIPDDTVKDIELALSLFEIVKETSTNDTLRKNADDGIKDIKIILETTRNKPQ